MTGGSWALAALLCWHLGVSGGLPKEVPLDQVRPWATGQQTVRVLVFDGAKTVYLRPQSAAVLRDADTGAQLATVSAGATIVAKSSGGAAVLRLGSHSISAFGVRIQASSGSTIISSDGGWGRRGLYPGGIEITANGSSLRVVTDSGLEDYLVGVVAAEVPASFPLQAMEAQAIAARTYTLSHLGDHAEQGADLCGQVHCQAYAGLPSSNPRARKAVRETAGQVLSWNGVLVDALYHSACGGSTAAPWEVRQGKLLPYLPGSDDVERHSPGVAYCAADRGLRWTARFSRQEAEHLVASNLGTVLGQPGLSPGHLNSLKVVSRRRERVQWLEIATSSGTYRVRGDAIRWLFGTGRPGASGLRSTNFTLTMERNRRGSPRSFVFRGTGHGHGIGLCQWGAKGRAQQGQNARQILGAYYPGAVVADLRTG